MGVGLHSRKTAAKNVAHIAKDIRCQIFSKTMKEGLRICVIVDEASTISCKPVLIIYVKVEDCELSPTIFLGLVELEGQYMQSFTSLTKIKCSSTKQLLGQEILKIGRVLGPRWAACSLRAAQAVFFCSDTKFLGMVARMSNK